MLKKKMSKIEEGTVRISVYTDNFTDFLTEEIHYIKNICVEVYDKKNWTIFGTYNIDSERMKNGRIIGVLKEGIWKEDYAESKFLEMIEERKKDD
jgi:hypothetical protein